MSKKNAKNWLSYMLDREFLSDTARLRIWFNLLKGVRLIPVLDVIGRQSLICTLYIDPFSHDQAA